MGHHFRHIDGVAEMVGRGTRIQDGIYHLDGAVAAVVIDNKEIIRLKRR